MGEEQCTPKDLVTRLNECNESIYLFNVHAALLVEFVLFLHFKCVGERVCYVLPLHLANRAEKGRSVV